MSVVKKSRHLYFVFLQSFVQTQAIFNDIGQIFIVVNGQIPTVRKIILPSGHTELFRPSDVHRRKFIYFRTEHTDRMRFLISSYLSLSLSLSFSFSFSHSLSPSLSQQIHGTLQYKEMKARINPSGKLFCLQHTKKYAALEWQHSIHV